MNRALDLAASEVLRAAAALGFRGLAATAFALAGVAFVIPALGGVGLVFPALAAFFSGNRDGDRQRGDAGG